MPSCWMCSPTMLPSAYATGQQHQQAPAEWDHPKCSLQCVREGPEAPTGLASPMNNAAAVIHRAQPDFAVAIASNVFLYSAATTEW